MEGGLWTYLSDDLDFPSTFNDTHYFGGNFKFLATDEVSLAGNGHSLTERQGPSTARSFINKNPGPETHANSVTFPYERSRNSSRDVSDEATVYITVNAVNDAPVASDMEITTGGDTDYSGTFSATDVDDDELSYSILDDPDNGSVTNSNETFTYSH